MITVVSALSSVGVVVGAILACHKWFLKQEKQDEDIAKMKEENCLICYGLEACLDGLEQLGANHSVPHQYRQRNHRLFQTAFRIFRNSLSNTD